MIRQTNGDLVAMAKRGAFDVIVHGANCYSTMGAGIAKQIKAAFPSAYKVDSALPDGPSKLGGFSVARCDVYEGKSILVVNAYTQLELGADFRPGAYRQAMARLASLLRIDLKIGIPLIGCGIGGGNWAKVLEDTATIFERHDVTVVHFTQGG